MNVKNSLCMNKSRYISALLLLLGVHCYAQDYETYLYTRLSRESGNINWIRSSEDNFSYAELSTGYTDGTFHSPFEGNSLWSSSAKAKSIKQFEKFSLQGSFSFSSSTANGACGSMSAVTGYYPVDVYEFTPGKKSRQIYDLSGGSSFQLSENWLIGGNFIYQGQNYTKLKDLRHTTYHMSLQVCPSVLYKGDEWSAGGAYSFRRNTQSIVAEEIGINSGVYYAFLDKGLFYGVRDIWDNSAVHLKESGLDRFPVQENLHSLSLQGLYHGLYAELAVLAGKGKIGEKQKIWYDYDRSGCSASLAFRLHKDDWEHIFRVKYSCLYLKNYENILEDVTVNGITTTYNYGSLPVLAKATSLLGYEHVLCNRDKGTLITAYASVSRERGEASLIYPYVGSSDLLSVDLGLSAIFRVSRRLEALVHLRAQKGYLDDRSRCVSDTQASATPQRAEDLYAEMIRWQTDFKLPVCLGARYSFGNGLYAKYAFTFIAHKNGQMTNTLAIGYNF